MTSDPRILQVSAADGIATLILNRPAARNSLSLDMLHALQNAFEDWGARADIKVIVLAANGPAFCAGHDLKEMTAARENADGGRAFYRVTMETCSATMQAIVTCPKPVIAAVHGTATAAGCQLVASCDLAIAAEGTRFATPGVNIGLFCSTPMVALSRNVGRKQAMKMLLTGQMTDAETALNWGLISDIVPMEQLQAEAGKLAALIAGKSGRTLKIGKEAFYAQAQMSLEKAYDYATGVMVENMMIDDAKEGIQAFIEKRAPEWPAP
ncbi:enoyl-CoA hydratase [Leisingera sp. ANG-Vp]|uniref:enoyl-CoA hydratase n=1 Tax=Leisingera sp. ANG-Vp TaxID=1577896 RepID=UPI00057E337A|nr:enoyl-CoA hydratase [Leisingera sp. ANG-Vp]KIC20363.1 enoyl-CoA hydratase [Leisingera sp. ANG-Vp]